MPREFPDGIHWEHGYRVHGLWRGDDRLLGRVGLTPRGGTGPTLYTAMIARDTNNGQTFTSLEAAKRWVEKQLGLD